MGNGPLCHDFADIGIAATAAGKNSGAVTDVLNCFMIQPFHLTTSLLSAQAPTPYSPVKYVWR
ncbi:hypothetical protein [Sodalis sp. (in: enterobacteria)]|uniref:hypothetical protein n=1 Tax=Sodalis sp. (in: enterobacteria) TaxID=1898979 RepID=UPI003F68664A